MKNDPKCDIDDDWTATFQRKCREPNTVPCLIDEEKMPQKQAPNKYRFANTLCHKWGLDIDCNIREDVADLNPEGILR